MNSYREVLDDPPPAMLAALLPEDCEDVAVSDVLRRLSAAGFEGELAEPTHDQARWEIEMDTPGAPHLFLAPPPQAPIGGIDWRGVTDADTAAAERSRWAIAVMGPLGDEPLERFHLFVRMLAGAAPEAVLVMDVGPHFPHPGGWLHEVGGSEVPPSPRTLVMIHAVSDGQGPVWLHTHGLNRCGAIDLDIVEAPADLASELGELLNAVAMMFIERGTPPPNEPFWAGNGMELVWLPWEQGVRKVARRAHGGRHDRDDDVHGGARGILFAPERGLLGRKYRNPAIYRDVLENSPVFFVSSMETVRMSRLAVQRLDRFRALFDRFGADDEEWAFLVKLGYEMDDEETSEHMWFQVHGFDGDRVDATLTNQPHAIAAMNEGDRGMHDLERLSDWTILCEHGRFGADNVAELERELG